MIKEVIRQMPGREPNSGQKAQMERKFGMFLHLLVDGLDVSSL